jgi:hypothetical protein
MVLTSCNFNVRCLYELCTSYYRDEKLGCEENARHRKADNRNSLSIELQPNV